MAQEKHLLEEARLPTDIIEDIIEQSHQLKDSLPQWNGNSKLLFQQIRLIRESTCNLSRSLKFSLEHNLLHESESTQPVIKRQLRRPFYVIIGSIIIDLNAHSSLNPLLSALSGALGNAFIGQAVPPA